MLFAAANFVLLALTLSSVNLRVGRSGNPLFALFAFVVYYNLLNLGQSWVDHGRVRVGVLMLALHGGALLLGLLWLGKRHPPTRCAACQGPEHRPRMKTIRRLIYVEVLKAVGFVALGFLSLFFFDFVDELQSVARPGILAYSAPQALLYVTLLIPSHLYELPLIAVLIGTIFVMARLAQESGATILRTSDSTMARLADAADSRRRLRASSPSRWATMSPWLPTGQRNCSRRASGAASRWWATRGVAQGEAGRHLLRGQRGPDVAQRRAQGHAHPGVRCQRLPASQIYATGARAEHGRWTLVGVERQEYAGADMAARVVTSSLPVYEWPTSLTTEMVSVALLRPERMRTYDLFDYIGHLEANGRRRNATRSSSGTTRFYPCCFVMIALALPFAYLQRPPGGHRATRSSAASCSASASCC